MTGEYERRRRDLLVARLDFRRCRYAVRRGDGDQLRRDIIRAAEHLHDMHAEAIAPAPADPLAVWAAAADDVVTCVAAGRWRRLKPTAWGDRKANRWWCEMSWPRRGWKRFWAYYQVTAGRALDCLGGQGDYESYLLNRMLAEA